MALVKLKPTSPGRRGTVRVVNPDLHKGDGFKPLLESKRAISGRNNVGRIMSVTEVVVISVNIVLLISVVLKTLCRPR